MRFAEDLRFSSKDASLLFIYIGLCSTLARIVVGITFDKKWITSMHGVQLSSLTIGLAIALFSLAKTYGHFVVFAVAYGLGNGAFITSIVACFCRAFSSLAKVL